MDGFKDATLSSLATVVRTASPVLAQALTGNAAGVVLALLGALFGGHDGTPSGIAAAIQAAPDASYRLRKLETDHAEFLATVDQHQSDIDSTDRQNARTYAATYRTFLMTMAMVVTAGFFVILFLMFIPWNLSDESKNLLSMLVGMLASKWQTIMDFFFGSSHVEGVRPSYSATQKT